MQTQPTGHAEQAARPRSHHAPGRTHAPMTDAAFEPLKELSQQSGISMTRLLDEAVALLLLERDEPVPPKLRAKVRLHEPERR